MPFLDRADAGRRLAGLLTGERGEDTVVLGLPRGGVPVAYEIARALSAPLDVILVRKVGLPAQPELAMGAIGEDGVRVVNDDVVEAEHVSDQQFGRVEALERAELSRRADRYRTGRPRVPLAGKTAIVVDDGIATGSTARAACQVARAHGAARVVLAVPLAPQASIDALASVADEVICAEAPEPFLAIGQWYRDFEQTGDDEVVALLRRAASAPAGKMKPGADGTAADRDVIVLAGPVRLPGRLTIPGGARGVVVFAHGSGSSRNSPRNMFVAGALHVVGLGSLLFDLLTPEEEADRANVFDIGLLASRLSAATTWLRAQPGLQQVPVGYFGASTGVGGGGGG
ncbi:MAG: phosphoribosyltransferase family protein, partial [Streptosporangiaceae bacterium]